MALKLDQNETKIFINHCIFKYDMMKYGAYFKDSMNHTLEELMVV